MYRYGLGSVVKTDSHLDSTGNLYGANYFASGIPQFTQSTVSPSIPTVVPSPIFTPVNYGQTRDRASADETWQSISRELWGRGTIAPLRSESQSQSQSQPQSQSLSGRALQDDQSRRVTHQESSVLDSASATGCADPAPSREAKTLAWASKVASTSKYIDPPAGLYF